jgi:hypothetical protein
MSFEEILIELFYAIDPMMVYNEILGGLSCYQRGSSQRLISLQVSSKDPRVQYYNLMAISTVTHMLPVRRGLLVLWSPQTVSAKISMTSFFATLEHFTQAQSGTMPTGMDAKLHCT